MFSFFKNCNIVDKEKKTMNKIFITHIVVLILKILFSLFNSCKFKCKLRCD